MIFLLDLGLFYTSNQICFSIDKLRGVGHRPWFVRVDTALGGQKFGPSAPVCTP